MPEVIGTTPNNNWPGPGAAGSNPSIGTTGSPAPIYATEIGGIDPSGNLQPAQVDASKNLLVNVQTSALPNGAATAANQVTGNNSLSTIATNTTGVATAANQVTGNNSLSTIATNTTGVATAANQVTGNNSLATIATNTNGVSTAANQVTGNNSLATIATNTTGVATAANQTTGNNSLATIATNTTGVSTAANQTNGNQISQITAVKGTLTDRSGTIAVGGTAQNAAAANAARKYFMIQNIDPSLILYVNPNGTASAAPGSIELSPNGGGFVWETTFVPTSAISVFSTGTAKFTAMEA